MVEIRTTLTVQGGAEHQAKELRPATAEGLRRVGAWWHEDVLPGHFDVSAQQKYGYAARKKGYMIYKAKRFHTRRPLYLTGHMKEAVEGAAQITADSKGLRVRMRGPKYLYQMKKAQSRVDKAAELTRISSNEEREMDNELGDHISEELDTIRTTETRQL